MIATVPDAFCWTRFGSEAGEGIDAILARKEAERRATGGMFAWGIGNALGDAVDTLAAAHAPMVAFSPMAGRAAERDASPRGILAWRSYVAADGRIIDLPGGVLVTSRGELPGGSAKARHYALFCRSDEPLVRGDFGTVGIGALRNFVSGSPVGASQTTAVVMRVEGAAEGRVYPIALLVPMAEPWYARLANPVGLGQADVDALYGATTATPAVWVAGVRSLLANGRDPDGGQTLFALQDGGPTLMPDAAVPIPDRRSTEFKHAASSDADETERGDAVHRFIAAGPATPNAHIEIHMYEEPWVDFVDVRYEDERRAIRWDDLDALGEHDGTPDLSLVARTALGEADKRRAGLPSAAQWAPVP